MATGSLICRAKVSLSGQSVLKDMVAFAGIKQLSSKSTFLSCISSEKLLLMEFSICQGCTGTAK